MNAPLPPCLCPHGWRKFEQAQRNMLRRFYGRQHKKNYRRTRKWAQAMNKWLERIYRNEEWT